MKKQLTKKILLTVGLALLIGLCLYLLGIQIYSTVSVIKRYFEYGKTGALTIDYFLLVCRFLFYFANLILYIYLIVKLWKYNFNHKK